MEGGAYKWASERQLASDNSEEKSRQPHTSLTIHSSQYLKSLLRKLPYLVSRVRMAPSRVVENWVLSKLIGQGGFGKVWIGYHAQFYCMRVIKEIQLVGNGSDVKNEVEALRALRGPNIVQMVDAFEVRKWSSGP